MLGWAAKSHLLILHQWRNAVTPTLLIYTTSTPIQIWPLPLVGQSCSGSIAASEGLEDGESHFSASSAGFGGGEERGRDARDSPCFSHSSRQPLCIVRQITVPPHNSGPSQCQSSLACGGGRWMASAFDNISHCVSSFESNFPNFTQGCTSLQTPCWGWRKEVCAGNIHMLAATREPFLQNIAYGGRTG